MEAFEIIHSLHVIISTSSTFPSTFKALVLTRFLSRYLQSFFLTNYKQNIVADVLVKIILKRNFCMKWLHLSDFDLLYIGYFTIYIFSQQSITPHLIGIDHLFYKKKFKKFYC